MCGHVSEGKGLSSRVRGPEQSSELTIWPSGGWPWPGFLIVPRDQCKVNLREIRIASSVADRFLSLFSHSLSLLTLVFVALFFLS